MTDMDAFLLVPNHSMAIDGDIVKIESAEADMLQKVRERFGMVGIAAFTTHGSNSSLAGAIHRADVTLHRLNRVGHRSARLGKLINYIRAAVALPFILPRYDFLYIFCPGYCGLLAALWARIAGKPYALYVRGSWLGPNAHTAPWWRWVFNGARFMIVTGEAFRRRLLKHCGNVVNEVPLTALRPADIDPSPPARMAGRLLFAGQLTEAKGLYDVLRAVAILKCEGRDVELTIAGGGVAEQVDALTRLRDQAGLQDCVRLLGHIPAARMAAEYQRSGLFVFPSYYAEGFPRVLYEAMMYSLPIVTCEMPGTQGFLVDGENCVYCRPSAPEHLAACLRRLLNDAALAERLGCNARKDVEQLYDSFIDDSHARQLLRLLSAEHHASAAT